VTFTATLSLSGVPGTVTFSDGGTAIGTGTISGTTASFPTSALAVGTHSITASYAASSYYKGITSSAITQTVNKTVPTISWATPAAILYGTPLSATQLDATSNVAGTFVYSPAAGTVLAKGAQTLSTTFTPTIPADYTSATGSVSLVVTNAPTIIWPTPAAILQGTPLSATQLDASCSLPGTFVYSPAPGTVLPAGAQTLSVTFTPLDSTDYATVTATVPLTVNNVTVADTGTVTLTVNNIVSATTTYGQTSTPSTVAQGLAAGVTSGSPVNVTAVDNAVYVEAKTADAGADYGYTLQTTNYNSSAFSQPSFMNPAVSGALEGGAPQNTAGQTVYSYTVPTGGYAGNNNLLQYTDSVMGTWNFSYDTLNRLAGATDNESGNPSTNYCWGYDAFGNRTLQTGSTAAFQTGSPTCTPASGASVPTNTWANYNTNNQMISTSQNSNQAAGYDVAGDVTNDGVNQYLYDAEGRICAVANTPVAGMTTMTGYIYDAGGQRVSKGTVFVMSCDPAISGFKPTNDYILGPSGAQMTEMAMDSNNSMAWQHTNVYAAGRLLATYDNDGLHFHLADPLGTRRAQTDYAGVLEQTCSSLPFGDGLSCTGSVQYPTEHHFAGKERDSESGLDNFGARYSASIFGRFMTPDSSPNGIALGDPQSWNLYSYARNRPTHSIDLGGNWSTPVHAEMVTVALEGLVSAGELKQLIAEQYVMDKNQAPEFQFEHAMSNGQSNPPQSAQDASNKMLGFVADMMGGASATLGPNGQFNSTSLAYLGDAIHTVQDYTSPMHTSSSGDPLPWYGAAHGGFQHWQGENSPSDDWAGFGKAIRLTMAAFMQANPELAKKNGLTQANLNAESDRRISQYVENFYRMSGNVMGTNNMKEEAARQCALGNPAACF
jgi:RHS repeat-associated protein